MARSGRIVPAMRLLYKPFGILMGILAGLIGRQLFNFIWGKLDKEEPPEATTQDSPAAKVIGAAVLQGAIFAGVRAGVDRAGAHGFHRATGVWPGEKRPEPE